MNTLGIHHEMERHDDVLSMREMVRRAIVTWLKSH